LLTSSTTCRSEPVLDQLFGADEVEQNLGDDLVFNSSSDLFFDLTGTNFYCGLGAIVETCNFSSGRGSRYGAEGRGAGAGSSVDGVHDEGRGARTERMLALAEEEIIGAVDLRSGDEIEAPTLGDEFHTNASSRRRSPGGWWSRRSRRSGAPAPFSRRPRRRRRRGRRFAGVGGARRRWPDLAGSRRRPRRRSPARSGELQCASGLVALGRGREAPGRDLSSGRVPVRSSGRPI
jgi:hypothetical protein